MSNPSDAYREGYDRGRNDSAGGVLAEITMGMLRDDPGGHFAAGYRDGAAGKKFNPSPENVRKAAAERNPFDDQVAIKTVCPNCGALDWFEWKFLGKLTDPICGHTWYVGSGTYALMQFRAAFYAGGRLAKYWTSGLSGEGAWIAKALGWFMGVILGMGFRLEFGILMIPLQAVAGLFQAKQTNPEKVTRLVVLGVMLAAVGILYYQTRNTSTQFVAPQQFATMAPSQQAAQSINRTVSRQESLIRPSFNCAKARTRIELLVCRDGHLATLDVQMATAYNEALSRLPQDGRQTLKQAHLAWFKSYRTTCNQIDNDNDRATCIGNFLSARTAELNNPR